MGQIQIGGEVRGSYIGTNFTGLSMIKGMVIRPLVIATEKVVEYYFPEEKLSENPVLTSSQQ